MSLRRLQSMHSRTVHTLLCSGESAREVERKRSTQRDSETQREVQKSNERERQSDRDNELLGEIERNIQR